MTEPDTDHQVREGAGARGVGDGANAIERGVDLVARSRTASILVILVVTLSCLLPGFTAIHPIDRDEARFAQATKQMVETGDYVNIRVQDTARNKKPIGIHWLQAVAVALSGEGSSAPIWVYRIPSLLGALSAVLLTWWMALAFGDRRAALVAGLAMGAIVILGVEARLATTDGVLLAATMATGGALARVWLAKEEDPGAVTAFVFWAGLALAVLVKGPVILILLGFLMPILVVYEGSLTWLKWLRPKAGLIGFLIAVLPWFIAIAISTGGTFFSEAVGEDLWAKVVSPQERHGAPPGTYLLALFLTFWPAAAYFCLGLPWVLENVRRPALVFAVAWAVPLWLLFESFETKLPHYVMPAYPALALVLGMALSAGAVHARGWIGILFSLGPLVVPAVIAVGVPILFFMMEGTVPVGGTAILILGAGVGAYAWHVLVRRDRALASFVLSLAAAAILYAGFYGQILPNMEKLRISGRLAEMARAVATCPEPEFAAAGYAEPSLIFLAGTGIRLVDGAGAADFIGQNGCHIAMVEFRALPQFLERAEDLGFNTVQRGQTAGVNISNGRSVEFGFYEREQRSGDISRP